MSGSRAALSRASLEPITIRGKKIHVEEKVGNVNRNRNKMSGGRTRNDMDKGDRRARGPQSRGGMAKDTDARIAGISTESDGGQLHAKDESFEKWTLQL